MKTPAVSVLMPVYNAESYVAEAVESILAQTFSDFEFIIINDGSTDGSLDILKRYAEQDKRIRLLTGDNLGYVLRLNEALALAKAPLVARMDADDIALPERLSVQVEFMRTHQDVVCAGGGILLIDEAGRFILEVSPPTDDETLQQQGLSGTTPICHPCVIMRRDAVEAVGRYDPEMVLAEDLDLWLRLGEIGKLANVDTPVLRYRFHSGSVSETDPRRQHDQMRRACELAWERRGIEGRFDVDAPWRPLPNRRSQYQFFLKYGWWAFNSGERRTAMIYGAKAVKAIPWSPEGWRLLVCAAFKPIKGPS